MNRDLRPMPAQADPALLARCAGIATSSLGHWRLWGQCDRRVRALGKKGRVAGIAVTLALPGPDGALLHETLGLLRPGDILAIDRLGDTIHACIGGIVARAALARGVAAIVVDGPVADLDELGDLDLPVWGHGPASRTTRRLGLGGRFNAAVSVGGVVIEPGDILICDADGVAAIAPGELDGVLAHAAERDAREASILAGLAEGRTLADLLPAAPLDVAR